MGIGEALVTVLNEKGIPTPLAHTLMRPPLSRIGVLTNGELQDIIDNSDIKEKYEKVVDRESAYELLQGKMSASKEEEDDDNEEVKKSIGKKEEEGGGILDTVGDAVNSPVGKIVMREVTRGLLGVLGLKSTTTRRRKSKGLFW